MTSVASEDRKKVLTMAEYISKTALYGEVAKLEELARNRYLDTPSNSPAYPRYTAQMQERTALKHLIADFPAADVAPVQKWISVKDKLPEPEQEVLVCVRSKISNYRYVCCAMHVPDNWYRQSSDFCWDFECCDEYDEEQDDYIVKQGWYESIHNWDDYSVVGIEDIVTHWMPLPQHPKGE